MGDLTDDPKSDARKRAFAARKRAHGEGHGAALTAALLRALAPVRDTVIAGYMPIRTEADPLPAMTDLAQSNRLCVPVIAGQGLPLKFRAWHPDAAMIEGPFGARVPAEGGWLVPQVLIVPLVAFDRCGNRLGYGGGFYDRTLEALRAKGSVTALGLAYAAQELPDLPLEPTDQPLDGIVTEAGTLAVPGITP